MFKKLLYISKKKTLQAKVKYALSQLILSNMFATTTLGTQK